jgi:hypothetical protein
MKAEMIAPCGMNCNVCRAVLDKEGKNKKCPGCVPREMGCIHGKGLCEELVRSEVRFCYKCDDFPCARLKRLDKRYRTRYHYGFIEALEFIRENGMKNHLANEKTLWKCPECGGTVCIHNGKCYKCLRTVRKIG